MLRSLRLVFAEGGQHHRQAGGVQAVTEHHGHRPIALLHHHALQHFLKVSLMPVPLVGSEPHFGGVRFQVAVHLQDLLGQGVEHPVLVLTLVAGCHPAEVGILLGHIDEITAVCPVLGRGTEVVELVGSARCAEGHLGAIDHELTLVLLEVGTEHLVMETGAHQVVEASVLGIHRRSEGVHLTDIQDDAVGTAAHQLDEIGARRVGRHHQRAAHHGFGTQLHVGLTLLLHGALTFLFPHHQRLVVLLLTGFVLLVQQLLDELRHLGRTGHNPLSAGRRGDDGEEEVRIDGDIVIHHPHGRLASAEVGQHGEEEHVALTAGRFFYSYEPTPTHNRRTGLIAQSKRDGV